MQNAKETFEYIKKKKTSGKELTIKTMSTKEISLADCPKRSRGLFRPYQ